MSTWRIAFREQARSDFLSADVLALRRDHASQTTMLLQMAWEKLAKAALVMSGAWDPLKKSHKVAAKFASVLKKAPRIEQVLGSPSRLSAAARLTWLQGELEALEALTPALATGGENAEYPWEGRDANGAPTIRWPAAHLTRRFCNPSMRGGMHLRKDFVAIEQQFDRLF
jgi:hypothetical protein